MSSSSEKRYGRWVLLKWSGRVPLPAIVINSSGDRTQFMRDVRKGRSQWKFVGSSDSKEELEALARLMGD